MAEQRCRQCGKECGGAKGYICGDCGAYICDACAHDRLCPHCYGPLHPFS